MSSKPTALPATGSASPTRGLSAGLGARLLALDVLLAVELGGRSDRELDRALGSSALDGRDRRLVTEIVYGTLRRQGSLDQSLAPFCSRPLTGLDPVVRVALRIGLYQCSFLHSVPAHAAIDRTVEALKRRARRATGLVNAVLRSWLRAAEKRGRSAGAPSPSTGAHVAPVDPPPSVQLDTPTWLAQRWHHRYGVDRSTTWWAAALAPPVVALRIHPEVAAADATTASSAEADAGDSSIADASVAALVDALATSGVTAEPSPWSTGALRLDGGMAAALASPVHNSGVFSPRSEAAQLVTELLAPPAAGEWTLDVCAGRGGKAVQLAEAGHRVLALDVNHERLRHCHNAARRAGVGARVHSVRAAVGRSRPDPSGLGEGRGLLAPPEESVASKSTATVPIAEAFEGFSRILVDAPRSGIGTVRRHPEIKWRLESSALERHAAKQLGILCATLELLAAGGELLYVTCSTEPEENEEVVQSALQAVAGIELVDLRERAVHAELVGVDGFVRTYPDHPELDGFFAACLRRTASPGTEEGC